MVRSIHKTKLLFILALVFATPALIISSVYADNPLVDSETMTFRVNVDEVLTVSITDPTNWASGSTGEFLRNKVNVAATTNSPVGVTVSMYTDNTSLFNTTSYDASDDRTYIPTVDNTEQVNFFPDNRWGYSVDDTDAGIGTAHYDALQTSANPILLFSTVGTSTIGGGNEDVYFGAKATTYVQSGTYAQTVYFAAVTGTIDSDNPAVPVNPSTPDPTNEIAHYSSSTGQTTYTTRTTSGSGTSPITGSTDTTTTNVTKGDTTTTYAHAAGVTTSSNNGVNSLAVALAASAAVAATTGTLFFVAAKRRKDDDEEEQQ